MANIFDLTAQTLRIPTALWLAALAISAALAIVVLS